MKKLLLAMLVLGMLAGCSNSANEGNNEQEAKGATIETTTDTVEIPMGSLQVDWKNMVYEVVTVTSADGSEIADDQLFLKGSIDTATEGAYTLTLVITENGVRTEKDLTLVVKAAEEEQTESAE